jgi:hypothetical protein
MEITAAMAMVETVTEGAIDIKPILPKAHFKLYPKQMFALNRPEHEILYGGSRGGAKTIGGIAWIAAPRDISQYRSLVIRKNADDLKDWIDRATIIYRPYGAKKVGTPPEFRWPSGARTRTGHLNDADAYEKYQGHEYQRILIEELTQIPDEVRYLMLISACRSTIDGLPAQVFITTNPGGPGHQWVKSRFVECCPARETFFDEEGRARIFIPSTIEDNPILMQKDPSYVAFLNGLPPGLKEAWRDGSWDFVVGAAFQEINREHHMIDVNNPPERLHRVFDFERMTPKADIRIFRSMDWGYAKPFSVGWYFSDYDGRIYRYREMYGCKGPDEGIQMPARDLAIKIKQIETDHKERITLAIADASIWDKASNQNEKAEKLPSIAETMSEEGIYFDRDISIDAKKSRIQGKHQMHERLRIDVDGLPHLQVFSTCVHWWRTVPVLPLDKLNPEDVDTDAEDHAYDECRYMMSARPMKSRLPKSADKPFSGESLWRKYGSKREVYGN